jgi:hypothetical protein
LAERRSMRRVGGMHFRSLIGAIRAKKLEIARLDPRRGMPVLPPVGATPRQIANVEKKLGRELPPSYREFLSVHDGWPELLHGTSLLGATHLARGTFDGVAKSEIDIEDGVASKLVAFGIDGAGESIFAWDMNAKSDDGELGVVVWVNEIGARLDDFPAFLEFADAVLESDVLALRSARIEPARPRAAFGRSRILVA